MKEHAIRNGVVLRRISARVPDYATGSQGIVYTDTKIRKAAIIPAGTSLQFSYDASYMAANKNFSYGAMYDQDERIFILAADEISTTDLILFDSFVFSISMATPTICKTAWLVKAKTVTGTANV